jgi:hypothetical protein
LSNENQPRLLSFTLDGWDVLGGRVSVSLSDRVAVLVGRNGAGKSAILEGFEDIASFAVGNRKSKFIQIRENNIRNFPKILGIEILTPNNRLLSYYYELISLPINANDFYNYVEGRRFSWSDCCQYVDGEKEILLETVDGVTTFNDENNQVTIGNASSFDHKKFHPSKYLELPIEMEWVFSVITGIRRIGDIPANQVFERHSSLLTTSNGI